MLVLYVQYYDKHIPRQEGDPIPACILDWHGFCFSIPIVDYIRNQDGNNKVDPTVEHA